MAKRRETDPIVAAATAISKGSLPDIFSGPTDWYASKLQSMPLTATLMQAPMFMLMDPVTMATTGAALARIQEKNRTGYRTERVVSDSEIAMYMKDKEAGEMPEADTEGSVEDLLNKASGAYVESWEEKTLPLRQHIFSGLERRIRQTHNMMMYNAYRAATGSEQAGANIQALHKSTTGMRMAMDKVLALTKMSPEEANEELGYMLMSPSKFQQEMNFPNLIASMAQMYAVGNALKNPGGDSAMTSANIAGQIQLLEQARTEYTAQLKGAKKDEKKRIEQAIAEVTANISALYASMISGGTKEVKIDDTSKLTIAAEKIAKNQYPG